ncbi:MAG: azurin [Proteobacteria bacterium]|nr:MAG: azurin [Pseudomonadota bacterium]
MIKISLLGLALAGFVSVQGFAADAPKAADAKAVEAKAADKKPAAGKATEGKAADAKGKGGDCTFTVEGTDTMKFVEKGTTTDLKDIKIPESCRGKDIKFVLDHAGKLPAAAMGHNFVVHDVSKQAAIVAEGMKAGPTVGYAPAKADGMIAHTKTIGGGESTDLKVAKGTLKAGTNYGYVCTFAGHAGIMHGTLLQ